MLKRIRELKLAAQRQTKPAKRKGIRTRDRPPQSRSYRERSSER